MVAFIGNLAGGAAMMLAIPIAILVVGVPIALVVRLVLSVLGLL